MKFTEVVGETENVIADHKLVDTEHTIGRLHLNRLRFYLLTNTSNTAVMDPAIVQQVVVVVVEQPLVVVVVKESCQVESGVQRIRRRCQDLRKQ